MPLINCGAVVLWKLDVGIWETARNIPKEIFSFSLTPTLMVRKQTLLILHR